MVGFPTLPILKRRRVLGAFFERFCQENLSSRSPILSINFMLNAREKSQVFGCMVFVRYKVRLIQFFLFAQHVAFKKEASEDTVNKLEL